MNDTLKQIADKLYTGNAKAVAALTQTALDEGTAARQVLTGGLIAAMDRVGVDFRDGVLFIPEVMVAARAMHAGLEILRPHLVTRDVPPAGKVVLGTVKGDLHDVGKKLVAMMMQGAGFELVDLGIDVPAEKFVEVVKTEKPDLLAMSALLTTTMLQMKTTIHALTKAGLRGSVKVIVGGAPVTDAYATEICADGYAPDAASAVALARALIGTKP